MWPVQYLVIWPSYEYTYLSSLFPRASDHERLSLGVAACFGVVADFYNFLDHMHQS